MFNSMSLAAYSQVSTLATGRVGDGKTIDLAGAWDKFYNAVATGAGVKRLLTLMAIIGVALIAAAIVKWAWDRRRGLNGGGSGAIWGALLIGAIMSAPDLLIPIVLQALDALINSVSKIWDATAVK